jgi:5'(3')-deoxyribonucleotidase
MRRRRHRYLRHNHNGRKRAIFDLDSIIANLMEPWVEWYNQEWKDNLTLDKITEYKIHAFVKRECGMKIYNFFKPPERYGKIPILAGASKGLMTLQNNNVDVFIATATAGKTAAEKYNIAHRAAPWLDADNVIVGASKEVLHGDFFVDDAPKNMDAYQNEWPDAHILTIAWPYNFHYRGKIQLVADSYNNTEKAWDQIVEYILTTDVHPHIDDELALTKKRLEELTQERDMWKQRASQHGCDVEKGDADCG